MRTTRIRLPITLFSLLILCFSFVHAQRIVNLIPVPFPVDNRLDAAVTIFTNPSGDTACIFITTEWNAAAYIINREQKLVQQFLFQKKDRRDKIISAFFSDGNIVFLAGYDKQITEYVYYSSNHAVESAELPLLTNNELIMAMVNANDALYILSCLKNSSVLVLRALTGFGEMKTDSMHITASSDHTFFGSSFYEAITTNHLSGKFMNYGYISSQSPDADVLNKDCKIYYENDSIYIVMNGFVKDVMLLSFNPKQPELMKRVIRTSSLSGCAMNINNSRFNSYLLHDKLYTISACETQMMAEAFDIKTGARAFAETTGSNEEIGYAITPVIQSISDPKHGQHIDRTLTTKQLLHKMVDGNAVLKAEENSHDIKLTIGSYKEYAPIRGDWLGSPFGLISTAGFLLNNSVLNENNERVARFVSVWDKSTFARRLGLSEVPLEDRLDGFRQNVKTYINCETLYKMNGSDMYLYYNANTKALTMVLL